MNYKHPLLVIAVCFAICTCTTNLSLGVQTPDFRIVLATAPPLIPPFSVPNSGPLINEAGQTAFGTGFRIFSEGSGTLEIVAQLGDQNFNLNSGARFSTLRLNAAGQTLFMATGGTRPDRIFSARPGEALELIASMGAQVPSANEGVVFQRFLDLGLSDSGQATFNAFLDSEENFFFFNTPLGIFSHNAGVLTAIAQSNDPRPGSRPGPFFTSFVTHHRVNASGQIAFADDEIFTAGPAGVTAVVLDLDPISNSAGGGRVFAGARPQGGRRAPAINAAGETAFVARVGDVSSGDFSAGILSHRSGALEQIAVAGDQAPGVEQGVVFALDEEGPFNPPSLVLNDAGQTAFVIPLAGENVTAANAFAIFSEGTGELELVARQGDQVRGAETGLRFGGFGRVELNGAGQTAFLAGLTTDGVNFDVGIFATDLDGQLIEIVRTGDQIDVSDDPLVEDLRTVSSLHFGSGRFPDIGGSGVSEKSFNDRGQLAFYALFTDFSEAFIVSDRAVPAPVLLGDCNQDGAVNFLDIAPFISTLSTGDFRVAADVNEDGVVNFLDISPFIALLSS